MVETRTRNGCEIEFGEREQEVVRAQGLRLAATLYRESHKKEYLPQIC